MTQTLEASVEETVEFIAKKDGWLVRKVSWPGRRGAPDRLFAKAGRHVFIEFKRPGKTPSTLTKRQINEHQALRDAGFEVYVCYSIVEAVKVLGI